MSEVVEETIEGVNEDVVSVTLKAMFVELSYGDGFGVVSKTFECCKVDDNDDGSLVVLLKSGKRFLISINKMENKQ